MIPKDLIRQHLATCLADSSFLKIPGMRKGKVRDSYDFGGTTMLITTDRQSAFDRILAHVPFKGQVLNQVSEFWFEKTRDIVRNHVIEVPDPNVTVAKKCAVLPVEFVVRGYLTGSTDTSAWMQYAKGSRNICGNILDDGMVKNEKFKRPILTPTTKSDVHDESISAAEIVDRGIIEAGLWRECEDVAFKLFDRGTKIAAEHGLILVDTKYEMGIDEDGKLCLIDEVHTPDSSRYWIAKTYKQRFDNRQEPENIDKEFLRLWFKDHCDPYNDKQLPEAPEDLVVELSHRYSTLYEMITGQTFEVDLSVSIQDRMKTNLAKYMK